MKFYFWLINGKQPIVNRRKQETIATNEAGVGLGGGGEGSAYLNEQHLQCCQQLANSSQQLATVLFCTLSTTVVNKHY